MSIECVCVATYLHMCVCVCVRVCVRVFVCVCVPTYLHVYHRGGVLTACSWDSELSRLTPGAGVLNLDLLCFNKFSVTVTVTVTCT